MADKKISALDPASLPLAGTEVIPIVQGGETKKVAISQLSGAVDSVNGQTGVVVLDADDVGAIPISGTTDPITGDLEFLNDVIGYTKRRLYSSSNDEYGDNTFEIFMNDPDGGVDVGLKRTNNTTGYISYIRLYPTSVEIGNDNIDFGSTIIVGGLDIQVLGRATSRGLSGQQDFTPNITDNDYTQKRYVDTKLPIETPTTTGVSLTFATDRIYGSIASPETGNITASVTGAKLGVTNIIIHNNGTAPTFDSKFKKLSGSGSYATGVVNYIYCTYITATEIIYSINQRT